MKTEPIRPARIVFADALSDGPPFAPDFGDVYHARGGAIAQAQHVFLGGNGLPARWQGRDRFVILETGFGLGHAFLATWAAWRADARRCERLWFVSIEKHPPVRDDLVRAHAALPCEAPWPELAARLHAAWPPLTPNLHTLAFDGGQVMLMLALGDVAGWMPQLIVAADAVYLDGFAPARNLDMWRPEVLKALAGRVAPAATAATWSVARDVRDGLRSAGFTVARAPGHADKRSMTVARYEPAFTPRRSRPLPRQARKEAVIVGAGLAGAGVAWALAQEGWQCTVLDRHPQPAMETSGNAAGLFHGVVHAHDGAHARLLRAAALEAARVLAPWLAQGLLPGRADGLLRLESVLPDADAMRELLHQLGLPPEYVTALDAAAAGALAGVRLTRPAWWYPEGGWLDPAALVRHMLDHERIRFQGGVTVHSLRPAGAAGVGSVADDASVEGAAGEPAPRWQLLDGDGRVLALTGTVVLANAQDVLRLLGGPPWPLERQRGQVTRIDAALLPHMGLRVPLAGDGYAIPLPDGSLLCGASTAAPGNDPAGCDATPRAADDRYNLDRLARLTGIVLPPGAHIDARVGWRVMSPDRLPLIGAVPRCDALGRPASRVRDLPRAEGLFVCTAFGTRGIVWAPLAGRLIAHWAAGAPCPLEARLLDALDPGRYTVRAHGDEGCADSRGANGQRDTEPGFR